VLGARWISGTRAESAKAGKLGIHPSVQLRFAGKEHPASTPDDSSEPFLARPMALETITVCLICKRRLSISHAKHLLDYMQRKYTSRRDLNHRPPPDPPMNQMLTCSLSNPAICLKLPRLPRTTFLITPFRSPKPSPLCLKRQAPTTASKTASVLVALVFLKFQMPFFVYRIFQSSHLGKVHLFQKSICVYL
jgi:hypothetical protein